MNKPMKMDIIRHIGAVTRTVGRREHEGREARVVTAVRVYDTDIDDAWDAITNRERIPRWLAPISGDLELGGRYQLEGNAGGTITACEPPRHLAVTWEFGGGVSWLQVDLAEAPGGATRLELMHTAHVEEHWNQFGPGAVGVGWDLALLGLAEYLASGAEFDRAEAEAWSASSEAKEFMRQSSDDWCRASIAAGTDAELAQAAAARTTAFYTGEGGESTDGEPAEERPSA